MKKQSAWAEWTLPNGLTCLYQQSPGLPLAAGTLLLRTGSSYECPDQAGLASLTAELLLQGTRQRSSQKLAEEMESVGASLGIQTSEDYTDIGHIAPVSHLGRILEMMAEMLTEPAFAPAEIQKERTHTLAALKSRQDAIFNSAYDTLNQEMYGAHPYGRPVDGRPETVRRFTRQDIQNWHRTEMGPERAVLAMISSLPLKDVQSQVERHLKTWKKSGGDAARPQLTLPVPAVSRRIRRSSRFEQAYLMLGIPAPAVNDPDYVALKVLNTLLGGGMSSRLFLRLREELGLAYEVSSFFPSHLMNSQWVIYLGTPPKKLAVAQKELERLLSALERKGASPQEVRQAAMMIRGGHVMDTQPRRRRAWYAAWWKFLGREPDSDQDFLRAVDGVTPHQIRTLSKRLLSQPRITVEMGPGR